MSTHEENFQQVFNCYGKLGHMCLPEKALEVNREMLADLNMQLDEIVGELDSISNLTPVGHAKLECVHRALIAIDNIIELLEAADRAQEQVKRPAKR